MSGIVAAPLGELVAVQVLTAQQGANLAMRTSIGFSDNLEFA